jgi:GntR family transcriptional repressor for pyruvate dehydrogenase complex
MTKPIQTVPLAGIIAERIQGMILEGVLRPGERLTPEREMAEKLGVSRPSLRQALTMLEQKGLLATGKGGTVVANFLRQLVDPLAELLSDDERAAADYFEFRKSIEAHASGLAALMRAAHEADDPVDEAARDVELHGLIYEAAHNVLLLHIMRVLADLMRRGVFYNREQLYQRPGVREALLRQHIAIGDSILAGDPHAAEQAATDHIVYTGGTIDEIRRDEMRMATSLRRIERRDLVESRTPGARQSP